MGGFWSSQTYLEEWDTDDKYNNWHVGPKMNTSVPYNVDLSHDFKHIVAVGDTNGTLCADLLLKYTLKKSDKHVQINKIELLKEKNSLFDILSILKLNQPIDFCAVNKRNIKHHIKDSDPVFGLIGIDGYDHETFEHDPLSGQKITSEYALAGLIVAYKNNTFKIMTGSHKFIYATEEYVINNARELWKLSILDDVVESKVLVECIKRSPKTDTFPIDFISDNSDNSDDYIDSEPDNIEHKIESIKKFIKTIPEPEPEHDSEPEPEPDSEPEPEPDIKKSKKRRDRRKKRKHPRSLIPDDFE